MTNNDVPTPADLPEKLRVHALAKLLGRTSREVIAALGDLGIEVRSAQASVDRKAAEQVLTALSGDASATPVAAGLDAVGPDPVGSDPAGTATVGSDPAGTATAGSDPAGTATARSGPAASGTAAAQSGLAASGTAAAQTALTGPDAAAHGSASLATADAAPGVVDDEEPASGRTRSRRTRGGARASTRSGRAQTSGDEPASVEISAPDGADLVADGAAGAGTEAESAAGADSGIDAGLIDSLLAELSAPEDTGAAPSRRPRRNQAPPLSPLFAPPAPLFQAPEPPPRGRRRGAASPVPEDAAVSATEDAAPPVTDDAPQETPSPRRRRRSRAVEEIPAEVALDTDEEVDDVVADQETGDGPDLDDDESGEAGRRRRRRGRRGRGRGRGADDEFDETAEEGADGVAAGGSATDEKDESDEGEPDDDEADGGTSRRRRRRRRRRGAGEDAEADAPGEDPPGTVVRIRPPREARDDDGDGVQGVRGSTRLEAKRQRRRDGRDAGRRKQPILSEAEFLARRESVERTMVVRERRDRVEIGVLEDEILVEHFVTDSGRDGAGKSLVGNIYLGRVQNVLPSMEAAFVDIGRGRNAVLYAGEVDWDAAGLGGKARRIEQALSSGDSVLVQVTKDPLGHKGARLTTQISLAGRFLVYVPSGGAAGISRKLPDLERRRLKDMLKEIVPSEAGVIIRTASEGVSHEALERDVRRLQAQWEVVKERAEQSGPQKPKAPVLLYEEPDLLIKVVRDQFNEDFSRLVIQGDDAWDTLHGYISHVAPELATRMHRHVGSADVFTAHRVDEQLLKALDRKVWLPSGGTLVIDRTEAMTVVDVNTGKFTGSGGNLEETVTRNNLEAAEEIVRQMRLRDIGGIIVVDFIDMVLEANRDLVLRRLTECLARDRTRHQVAEVTSLGLVQMTRKRVGGGLLEHFSHPCDHCRGRGVIVDVDQPDEQHERAPEPDRGVDGGGGRRSRGGRSRRGEQDTDGANDHNGHGDNGRSLAGPANGRPTVDAPTGNSRPDQGHGPGGNGLVFPGAPRPSAPAVVAKGDVTDGSVVFDVEAAVIDMGAPQPEAAPSGPIESGRDAAAEAVEEAVAEREFSAQAFGVTTAPEEPVTRPRRRGRVTRTAGAPSAPAGEVSVAAIVTVEPTPVDHLPDDSAPTVADPDIPAQSGTPRSETTQSETTGPDTVAAARPRRTRRAASRPAGPPVDGGGDPS